MNILLWIAQIALALLCFFGGAYKIFKSDALIKLPANSFLPSSAWRALGVFEVICGVLLVIPMALNCLPLLTPTAAAVVTFEDLALAGIYARRSLKLIPTNPLTYVAIGALLAGAVAYGRFALIQP